jgi:5-methyltetrahydropteroyltriglutamate--homocysteine methyltransferase
MAAKYRADHVGSFLRPAELLQARTSNVGAAQLRALEDEHILRALERQKELGFKIFTDGEFRRGNFMSDFNDAVEGIDEGVAVPRTWQSGAGPSSRPSMVPGTVVDKIKQTRRLTEHEFAFLKQQIPETSKSRCQPPINFRQSTSRKASATRSTPIIPHSSGTSCR